eukprot:TRINITY_DN2681_c0_g1_i2.p1 TRINITY_DN2681_c0_g1~~TRINITY_DN2681_c0_g1_i2.p1  ORF type:complete len:159 (+),score=49.71 TRINITY_DN2681_c0_g1_i2:286-762(+)
MGVTPLRDMPLCGSAHVACTILREVVSVKLAHDGDDRVMHAAEFEVADSTARCRLVAASKPVVSALRRRVGQPCIALNAAARSLPSKHETQAFRLVLPPSACVLPYPCSTEELDGLAEDCGLPVHVLSSLQASAEAVVPEDLPAADAVLHNRSIERSV